METNQVPTPPLQEPVVQTEPPHHKPIKIIIVVILLTLATIVGVVAYQTMQMPESVEMEPIPVADDSISPTPTPNHKIEKGSSVGWSRIINSGSDFSFEYPSGWKPDNTIPDDNIYIHSDITYGFEEIKGPRYYLWADNKITIKPKEISFFDWYTKDFDPAFIDPNELIYETETVNGKTLHKIEGLPSRLGAITVGVTEDNENFAFISLAPYSSNNPFQNQKEVVAVFNQILSTFRFLEEGE